MILPNLPVAPRLLDVGKGYAEKMRWRVWIVTATRAGHVDVTP
jgi:hypothetical protein